MQERAAAAAVPVAVLLRAELGSGVETCTDPANTTTAIALALLATTGS